MQVPSMTPTGVSPMAVLDGINAEISRELPPSMRSGRLSTPMTDHDHRLLDSAGSRRDGGHGGHGGRGGRTPAGDDQGLAGPGPGQGSSLGGGRRAQTSHSPRYRPQRSDRSQRPGLLRRRQWGPKVRREL